MRLSSAPKDRGSLTVVFPNGSRKKIFDSGAPVVEAKILNWVGVLKTFLDPSYYVLDGLLQDWIVVTQGSRHDLFYTLIRNSPDISSFLVLDNLRDFKDYLVTKFYNIQSRRRAVKDVRRHYDKPPEFYELFLDENMQYSCAYFRENNDTLDQAQLNKINLIERKLNIAPGMRVLDIGCGWGGLLNRITKDCDAQGVGVTISQEQFDYAVAHNASSEVQFRLKDYRDLDEKFDRIVSVGMLEHVGLPNYKSYFQKVRDSLTDDGVALIHTIGYQCDTKSMNPWIRRHIFPGTELPTLSFLAKSATDASLYIYDVDYFRAHYALTLEKWLERLQENSSKIIETYGADAYRAWELYIESCEVGFRHQGIGVFQMLVGKSVEALPIDREYMYEMQRDAIVQN